MTTTFTIVTVAWIFFRSDSVTDAFLYIKNIFINNANGNYYLSTGKYKIITFFSAISIFFLMVVEYNYHRKGEQEVRFNKFLLIILCLVIAFIGALKNHANFIYFQF